MSKTVLWAIISVLAATSAGQGYYMYSRHHPKKPISQDPWEEQDKWIAEARKHFFRQAPVPLEQFDELFDDEFFRHRFDPFDEIERFQGRMRSMLGAEEQPLFNRSWDEWFNDRMNVANIHPEVKTTENEVVLAFKIPGLDGESLHVNVNEDRIRITYDSKTVKDEKDEKGSSHFKSESAQHVEKVMPIPEGADARDNRIVHEGGTVKVIFKKVKRPGAKV